jgi:cytochrome c-type biogenesis protein CcmE
MKGLKKKRRVQVLALLALALAVSAGLIGYAMRDGINFFRTPTQVSQAAPPENEVFRIGGLVENGSLKRGEGETIRFLVTDGGAAVPVEYRGVLPDLFKEGQGMVATGRMVRGTFEATEILARHDESYMPKDVIDALKEQGVYVDPDAAPATN